MTRSIRYNIMWWFVSNLWQESGYSVSSTNKSDGRDITEILLKVTLNTNHTCHETNGPIGTKLYRNDCVVLYKKKDSFRLDKINGAINGWLTENFYVFSKTCWPIGTELCRMFVYSRQASPHFVLIQQNMAAVYNSWFLKIFSP